MHSIVVPCLCEEPLLTADQVQEAAHSAPPHTHTHTHKAHFCFSLVQVIEEIEGIMQDCSDWEAEQRLPRPAVSPGARRAPRGPGFDTGECDTSWML